jgi:hypothetical protein
MERPSDPVRPCDPSPGPLPTMNLVIFFVEDKNNKRWESEFLLEQK